MRLITGSEDKALVAKAASRISAEWPEFMLHDPVADYLADCYEYLPDFQFIMVEKNSSDALVIVNSIPLSWNDEIDELPDDGWDWAMMKGIDDLRSGDKVNILCALQILVFGKNRGRGISRIALEALKGIGQSHGLPEMIAPVRPTRKSDYPLETIEQYIKRTDAAGFSVDSWLRTHQRIGGKIIKPCHASMRISGTVGEWKRWTGMNFPKSDSYVIPGALVPVEVDLESATGQYTEPNVWMHHESNPIT